MVVAAAAAATKIAAATVIVIVIVIAAAAVAVAAAATESRPRGLHVAPLHLQDSQLPAGAFHRAGLFVLLLAVPYEQREAARRQVREDRVTPPSEAAAGASTPVDEAQKALETVAIDKQQGAQQGQASAEPQPRHQQMEKQTRARRG